MMEKVKVHVLEANPAKRARLARDLFEIGAHAEIYESKSELTSRPNISGFIIANDGTISPCLEDGGVAKFIAQTGLPICLYLENPKLPRAVRAMIEGAFDYMEWPIPVAKLADLLKSADYIQQKMGRKLKDRAAALEAVSSLSVREREVLSLAIEGHSNKSSAKVLDLSPRTVEIHRANAFKKINARSVAEAIRIGVEAELSV